MKGHDSTLRRLPTRIAITALIVLAGLYVAMWVVAYRDGLAKLVFHPNYGNHGVWRHQRALGALCDAAGLFTAVAAASAFVGGLLDKSNRTFIALALALAAMLVFFLHLMQFE